MPPLPNFSVSCNKASGVLKQLPSRLQRPLVVVVLLLKPSARSSSLALVVLAMLWPALIRVTELSVAGSRKPRPASDRPSLLRTRSFATVVSVGMMALRPASPLPPPWLSQPRRLVSLVSRSLPSPLLLWFPSLVCPSRPLSLLCPQALPFHPLITLSARLLSLSPLLHLLVRPSLCL